MVYGVEVSRTIVPKPKAKSRSPRGLDRSALLGSAFELFASEGEAGFSVRKLGAVLDIDPMTVLHHFGSKEELLRQIADRSLTTLQLPPSTGDWQQDLRIVARAYRALAHRYPRLFHLHFRFHATGPADHATSEVVYKALSQTGLPAAASAGLGLAFYAFVLGFALAEAEGLLLPLSPEQEGELRALDEASYPATHALVPAFKTLDPDTAFEAAIGAFVDGIESACKSARPRRMAAKSSA
jgi:AcrR family transcriptional regulator